MTTITAQDLKYVQQHKNHTRTLPSGDKVFSMPYGVYDMFCGEGWDTPIRFRIVRFRDKTKPHQLIQINGEVALNREYREQLLKEFP